MATYKLITNQTATQAAPVLGRPPNPSAIAHGPVNANMPAQEQAFQLVVTGIGALSATAQVVVSNDSVTWTAYIDPITASGNDGASRLVTGSGSWKHFGAHLTAISGTNAAATLTMSA